MSIFNFFKDKNFSEASQPKVNPKNDINSILQANNKSKGNANIGREVAINSPEQNSSILNRGPGR